MLFGLAICEMEEEFGGVSGSTEDWSLTYFAPNASLSSVRLQVAEPFPNKLSGMTIVRCKFFFLGDSFLALCFASFCQQNYLINCGFHLCDCGALRT